MKNEELSLPVIFKFSNLAKLPYTLYGRKKHFDRMKTETKNSINLF